MIGVIEILKANTGVTDIIGAGDDCKVFPLEAVQGAQIPYIVVRMMGNNPHGTKTGISHLDETSVAVYCCESSYYKSKVLGEAVRAALDRQSIVGTVEEITDIFFEDEDTYRADIGAGSSEKVSGSNKEIFETEQTYQVWIRRPAATPATITLDGFEYPAGTSFVEVPITFWRGDQIGPTVLDNFGLRIATTHGEPIDFIFRGSRQSLAAHPYPAASVSFNVGPERCINEPCYIVMPDNFNGLTSISFGGVADDPVTFPSDTAFDMAAFINTILRGGTCTTLNFDLINGGVFDVAQMNTFNGDIAYISIRNFLAGSLRNLDLIFEKLPRLSMLYIWRVVQTQFNVSRSIMAGAEALTRFDLQRAVGGILYETGALLDQPLLSNLNIENPRCTQAELDQIIIDLEANGTSNGYFNYTLGTYTPTSASYTAYLALISRGWTIIGTAPPAP
jgi:hypothetical protein